MSIAINDRYNTYKVHGTCPARGGTDNGPGGDPDGGANRRPVKLAGGGVDGDTRRAHHKRDILRPDEMGTSGGMEDTAKKSGVNRQNLVTPQEATASVMSLPGSTPGRQHLLAYHPFRGLCISEAGGYEVPGDGGLGRWVDMWL